VWRVARCCLHCNRAVDWVEFFLDGGGMSTMASSLTYAMVAQVYSVCDAQRVTTSRWKVSGIVRTSCFSSPHGQLSRQECTLQ